MQRAVVLAQKGYVYFLQGELRPGRDAGPTDRKLIEKSEAWATKDQRYVRKRGGRANAHYFRWDRIWVLMLTDGVHPMKERRAKERLRDLRNKDHSPLLVGQYSLKLRRDSTPEGRAAGRFRASVRLNDRAYLALKSELLELSTRRSAETLAAKVFGLPHQPYAPVYRQILAIVKAMNARRKTAGYSPLPLSCVRFRRDLPRHFVEEKGDGLDSLASEMERAERGKWEQAQGRGRRLPGYYSHSWS